MRCGRVRVMFGIFWEVDISLVLGVGAVAVGCCGRVSSVRWAFAWVGEVDFVLLLLVLVPGSLLLSRWVDGCAESSR